MKDSLEQLKGNNSKTTEQELATLMSKLKKSLSVGIDNFVDNTVKQHNDNKNTKL